jgi:hypothetical protein
MLLGTAHHCSSVNLELAWTLSHASKKLHQSLKFAMNILLDGPTGSSRLSGISQQQLGLAAKVSITKMELFNKTKSQRFQELIFK